MIEVSKVCGRAAETLIFPHIFLLSSTWLRLGSFISFDGRPAWRLANHWRGHRLIWTSISGRSFLGDRRRTSRLVEVAAAFRAGACCGGGGTITSVIASPHQAKAAYRLLDCDRITHESVIAASMTQVHQRLSREPGVYLLVEDTTALEYQGLEQAQGLGPIGEAFTRGFWLHSTLALRWDEPLDQCEVLGLAGQKAWARPAIRPNRPKS